ncbi:DUF6801 domain-containing protein [Streptomyces sp. NPDC014734]|uniref:DUF6801 domain-containing protein n=1 Tax=Streptomyces sp. NPDC014734 TaxID=3364886 RepID=UPI0037012ECF
MRAVGRPGTKLFLGAAAAVLAAGGGMGVTGAGDAAARPVSLALRYTCAFPVIGGQPVAVRINADIPGPDTVGVPTRRFPVSPVAVVSAELTAGLRFLGVQSVTGTAEGKVKVGSPQGDFDIALHFTIPKVAVPDSGSFRVPATGAAPPLTFTRRGRGKITAGDIDLHLVPKGADIHLFPDELDLTCTLDGGQNDVIDRFDILPRPTATAPATSVATPTTTAAPSGATTPTPSKPGVSGSGAPSAVVGTPGRTAAGPTGSASAATAKATESSAAAGAPAHATSRADTKGTVLLAAGGCAAVAAVLGCGWWFGRRRRRRVSGEGFVTVSDVEELP